MVSRPATHLGFALSLAAVPAIGIASCSRIGHPSGRPPTPPATTPTLALGRLDPGEKAEARLTLINRSGVEVRRPS